MPMPVNALSHQWLPSRPRTDCPAGLITPGEYSASSFPRSWQHQNSSAPLTTDSLSASNGPPWPITAPFHLGWMLIFFVRTKKVPKAIRLVPSYRLFFRNLMAVIIGNGTYSQKFVQLPTIKPPWRTEIDLRIAVGGNDGRKITELRTTRSPCLKSGLHAFTIHNLHRVIHAPVYNGAVLHANFARTDAHVGTADGVAFTLTTTKPWLQLRGGGILSTLKR